MKTLRKSTILFMALAVFAMILTGCKKDSSSSNGGGGGGNNVPTGNYGTVTVAGQSYTIALGGYDAWYEEEDQQYYLSIILADRANIQTANMVELTIVGAQSLPANGTYNYTIEDPMPVGSCGGMFESQQNGALICLEGTLTVSGTASNYTINTSGSATPMGQGYGQEIAFNVHFEGPLVQGK
jgi:hypothetical protein